MTQTPDTFEVSREGLAAGIKRRAVVFAGCSTLVVGAVLILANALNTDAVGRHLMEDTFIPLALFIAAFQALTILQITLWDLNRIAWRVRIREDMLHIDAVLHYGTIRWEDIAAIDLIHRMKQEVILKTYDGKKYRLAPPIPISDEYILELKRNATSSIEAADLDAGLASARRARLFGAEFFRVLRPIVACVILGVAFYSLYLFMQQNSKPSFAVERCLNADVIHLQAGKERPIATFRVKNFGVQTQGMKVSLTGDGLASGALKHPKVLISAFDRETLAGNMHVALNQHREVISLKQDDEGQWVGTSKGAVFKHQPSGLAEFVRLLRYTFDRPYAHSLEPLMEVEVSADIEPFKGRKEIILEVGALEAATHAGSSAQFEMRTSK